MITVVTIDFWNTLFDSAGGEPRNAARRGALLGAIRGAGHECADERFDDVYKSIWAFFDDHWLNRQRTPTSREMVDEILRRLELVAGSVPVDEVVELFGRGVLDHPPALLPGVHDALDRLSRRGIGMGLISDTAFSPGSVLRELMEREGIAKYFGSWVFSDESGVAKPHPEAFRLALEPFGASPVEACHIGDLERTDIKGAKAAGMKALLYRGDADGHKYAEQQTEADGVLDHWSQLESALERL